jgi:nickel-dependent lactate racemase
MRVELRYGRGILPVELGDEYEVTVFRKRNMPILPDPAEAVRSALAYPVGSRSLIEEARGKSSACILVCDITRPVPNGLFLGEMVRQILDGGVPREKITLLIATGLHRPNEGEELAEIIGDPWVMETVQIENHFARNDADHVELGTTSRGTPVKIDRRFVEADLRIATGLVEPHLIAGWSGGRKLIAPGVAHSDTIRMFHSSRYVLHPRATNCVLDGNPLHEDQLEIVKWVGGALALNTVIDEDRRLSFVNFGEIVESHLQAVAHVTGYAILPSPRRFKTVVTCNAGHPLDGNYYQTIKGVMGAVSILEPGGNLIVASECREGLGSHEFVEAQRRLVELGVRGFTEMTARKPQADIDEWCPNMLTKPLSIGNVMLYSTGLTPEQRELTSLTPIESIEAAIRESVAATGDPRVAVIPEGPYVIPEYHKAE